MTGRAAARAVVGPSAWSAVDVDDPRSTTIPLVAELADPRAFSAVAPRARAVVRARAGLRAAIEQALLGGRGFAVVTGVPVPGLGEQAAQEWCGGFCRLVGQPLPQSAAGDHVYAVRDDRAGGGTAVFTSKTNRAIPWHTDGGDLVRSPRFVALVAVRGAVRGGATQLVSALTLYNRLAAESPAQLRRLMRSFCYLHSPSRAGGLRQQMVMRLPVFERRAGVVVFRYNRQRIEAGHALADETLTRPDRAALDRLEELLDHPALRTERTLAAGDLLILHNERIAHARTEFTDPVRAGGGRLLYRLWIGRRRATGRSGSPSRAR